MEKKAVERAVARIDTFITEHAETISEALTREEIDIRHVPMNVTVDAAPEIRDRPAYSEGLRRGGYLLTARVDDEHSDQSIVELEQTNAIDRQARAELRARISLRQTERRCATRPRPSDEQAMPIVEERLRVGKREVDRGSVRVPSYIVEEPVREDVSLREERVEVERRPVRDLNARADEGLLQERTIEISERGEEAVVGKDAVVTEEVVVRKTADERIESIEENGSPHRGRGRRYANCLRRRTRYRW